MGLNPGPVEIAIRREQVAGLMLGYSSVRQIAEALGIHPSTAYRDTLAVRLEWQKHRVQLVDAALAEDLKRLEAAEKAIWVKVLKGDLLAIDRMLRIMERRAKLLGLDAPKRVDITARIRQIAIDAGLDPDEAVREAQRIVRALPQA